MSRRAHETDRVEEIEDTLFGGRYKFIRLKSGRKILFMDAITAADSAQTALSTAISRAFRLRENDWDLERLKWTIDHLETYVGALRHHLKNIEDVEELRTKIAALREIGGRDPLEAAEFLRKANQLEDKLKEKEKALR